MSKFIKYLIVVVIFICFSQNVLADTTASLDGYVVNDYGTGVPFSLVRWIDGRYPDNNRFVLTDGNGYANFRWNYNTLTNGYCLAADCPGSCGYVEDYTRPSRLVQCINYSVKLADYIYSSKKSTYLLTQLPSVIQREILDFLTCAPLPTPTSVPLPLPTLNLTPNPTVSISPTATPIPTATLIPTSTPTPTRRACENPALPSKIADLPSNLPADLMAKVVDYFTYTQPKKDYEILNEPGFDINTLSTVNGVSDSEWWAWQCGVTHTLYAYPPNYSNVNASHKFGPFKVAMNNGDYSLFTLSPNTCQPDNLCGSRCILDANAPSPENGTCYSGNCPGRIIFCIAPTPYPTINVKGNLKEDLSLIGKSCNNPLSSEGVSGKYTVNMASSDPKMSSTCTTSGDVYSCNVRLNNQYTSYAENEVNPYQELKLSASTVFGANSYWGKVASGCDYNCSDATNIYETCGSADNTYLNFSSAAIPTINRNVFVKRNDSDNKVWLKLKDTSFFGKAGFTTENNIPQNVYKYNYFGTPDPDDDTNPYFITGNGGVVTTHGSLSLGSINGQAKYSVNNWKIDNYSFDGNINSYIEYYNSYLKGKTDIFQTISSLDEIASSSKSIFFYSNSDMSEKNLIINNYAVSKLTKKIILVVNGSVYFDLGDNSKFNPDNSIEIVAKSINFYKEASGSTEDVGIVGYAKGIFAANEISTGVSKNSLKIKGNLIVLDKNNSLNMQRTNLDNTTPSIFIVFDPKQYLDMLGFYPVGQTF